MHLPESFTASRRFIQEAAYDDESSFMVVSDPDGNRVQLFLGTSSSQISSVTRDGVVRWSYTGMFDELRFDNAAFDPDGNVTVEATAFHDTIFFGRNIQQGAFLFKVDPSDEVLWLVHVTDSGYLARLGAAGDGTVVLLANSSVPFTWAEQLLEPTPDAPDFLLAAGADGSELWARQMEDSSAGFLMSVHPTGQIALAGGATGCNGTFVRNYDLAGNPLWDRTFDPQTCDGHVRARGLTFSDDDLVVTGDVQGTVDFGFGPQSFPQQRAFYLGLSR